MSALMIQSIYQAGQACWQKKYFRSEVFLLDTGASLIATPCVCLPTNEKIDILASKVCGLGTSLPFETHIQRNDLNLF